MTAILSATGSLAAVFQLVSIFLTHKTPVKRWIVPSIAFKNLLLSSLYLIPFLNIKAGLPIIFFVMMLSTNAIKNIVTPAKTNWHFSLIEDRKRGQFTAILNIVSLIGSTGFTMLISTIFDSLEKAQNLSGAFLFLTATILVLSVLHTASLILTREKPTKVDKSESHLTAIKHLFSNKKYGRVLVLYILWTVSSNVTMPFLGTYQINELGFSLTFIAILDVVLSLMRIPILYWFGRYSRRKSYASIMHISYVTALLCFICLAFTTKSNGVVLYTLYKLIYLIPMSAQGISSTNLIFDIVPANERTAALALNSALLGIIGFVTTLVASPLLDYIQANGNTFLGMNVFAQQVLAVISALITLIIIIYYTFFCRRVFDEKQ